MARRLREEAKVVAISEIMLEVRRVIIETRERERILREEEEAKAREIERQEDLYNLLVLKNVRDTKTRITMLLREARF
jgi:hypothetical protein